MYTSEAPKYSARADIGQTNRVLVVEDEELIREMLVVALEEEGYEVVPQSRALCPESFPSNAILRSNSFLVILRQK